MLNGWGQKEVSRTMWQRKIFSFRKWTVVRSVLNRNVSEKIYIEFPAIWCHPTTMKLILVEVKGRVSSSTSWIAVLKCEIFVQHWSWEIVEGNGWQTDAGELILKRKYVMTEWCSTIEREMMKFTLFEMQLKPSGWNRTFSYFCRFRFPNRGNCKMHWDGADRPNSQSNATALRLWF